MLTTHKKKQYTKNNVWAKLWRGGGRLGATNFINEKDMLCVQSYVLHVVIMEDTMAWYYISIAARTNKLLLL